MTALEEAPRVVSATREITAGPGLRWELEPAGGSATLVTHTYDWTRLTDEARAPRARATTRGKLRASLDRLAALAEEPAVRL